MDITEEWKTIPQYTNYEASNNGNIRNKTTQNVLRPFFVPDGYAQVRLSLGSRKEYKVCRVHRLVASAWIPNNENKGTVNHINTNKHDNRVENLEWLTATEQSLHYAAVQKENNVQHRQKFHDNNDDLENEVWKALPADASYMISSCGRLKNPEGKILRGHSKSTYIEFKIKNKQHIYAHRAVAKAFCDKFTDGCVVNHKDGDKKNNCASNLECLTQGENVLHAYNINKNKRRIPLIQYGNDGVIVAEYESYIQAGIQTGLKEGSIRWAIKHANGQHGGYIWKQK